MNAVLLRVSVFSSLTLPFTADPFPEMHVRLENVQFFICVEDGLKEEEEVEYEKDEEAEE